MLQVVSKARVTLGTMQQCNCWIFPLGNGHGIPMERNLLTSTIDQGFEQCGWNITAVAVELMTTAKGEEKIMES